MKIFFTPLRNTLLKALFGTFLVLVSTTPALAEWQTQTIFLADNTVKLVLPYQTDEWAPAEGTVIFLEGFGAFHDKYKGFHEALAKRGFNVIAYALLGQGERQRLPSVQIPNSSQEAGGHFSAYLEQLDQIVRRFSPRSKVTLIGHSLGGGIALAYASRNPDRIRQVIALSPMTGLPLSQAARLRKIFSRNVLGIGGIRTSLRYDETLDAVRKAIATDPASWSRPMTPATVAPLIAQNIRVHTCLKVLMGTFCKDRWMRTQPEIVEQAFAGQVGFSLGELPEGAALPTLLNLKNLIEAEQMIRDPKYAGNLSQVNVQIIASEVRDPLTPLPVIEDFRSLVDHANGRQNSVHLNVCGSEVVDRVTPLALFPPSAGHDVWRDSQIQTQVGDLLEAGASL